jgi:Arc/MetJ family transcription regulator
MRTNIVLNDDLIKQAFRYSRAKTKKDLVHEALEEFINNHRKKDPRKLLGKVTIDPNYDYKSARQ